MKLRGSSNMWLFFFFFVFTKCRRASFNLLPPASLDNLPVFPQTMSILYRFLSDTECIQGRTTQHFARSLGLAVFPDVLFAEHSVSVTLPKTFVPSFVVGTE
ncbi:hypothetical protein AVEN_177950-1 [Araneus ventricosus]|uniref:Secreted protein n=1 Tax=Araneus ventricosus TaxID=182803 RepID=A0A4Y2S7X6_ARAVE|nr:hypothetical protein AVEN_177950-1 [Araneus ventricosus]